jgi:hypothetical protein
MYVIYEFSHSSFEVNPQKTLFSKKDEVEWGRRVWGKPRKEEENVNKRDMV